MPEHIDSVKTYTWIFLALILATFLTTGVAFIDLGPFNVVTALVIAAGKMLLVALFFMHVRHSTRLTQLVVAGGMLWLWILISLTLSDVITRAWLPVPGH
ncbi:MAG: cytochrome C oxidase subunit IV family protein [Bryobacteraceae bacterium]